jgi:hypothetical protein
VIKKRFTFKVGQIAERKMYWCIAVKIVRKKGNQSEISLRAIQYCFWF